VYGSRVAADIAGTVAQAPPKHVAYAGGNAVGADEAQAISDLRNVMYTNVGLVRNERGLLEALGRIGQFEQSFADAGSELRNLLVVGRLITEAALARSESRGSHFRSDYAQANQALAKRSFTRLASA